jgi:hypothetical protein
MLRMHSSSPLVALVDFHRMAHGLKSTPSLAFRYLDAYDIRLVLAERINGEVDSPQKQLSRVLSS